MKEPKTYILSSYNTKELFSKVVVVEDDPSHAALITRACANSLGEITHVKDVSQAIEQIKTTLPELVLCDLNLGSDTGISLLRAAKEIRPTLPIIIMTSSNQIQDAVMAMREGAWDYITKDFDEQFRDRLTLVLDRVAERKTRELSELELRAERDAFWAAAHTAQNGMAVLNSSGRVIFSNTAFNSFLKIVNHKISAKNCPFVEVLNKVEQSVATALREQLQQGNSDSLWRSEITLTTAGENPTTNAYELTLNAVSASELTEISLSEAELSRIRKYVLWVRDITARRQREQFQRDLLSTTTHDIKGPLGAIITCVELINNSIDKNSREYELILRIGSCARNAVNIIDELLSARRIEDGVFVIRPSELNLAEVIEEICLEFEQMAEARKLSLTHLQKDRGIIINADKLALMRLLTNLISNAIKFTPAGGKITVDAERKENETVIKVTDNGRGIEAEKRHHLFEKYSRLDQHSQIDGTGLGLFVVRNIVDAHGGRIEVQSKVGQGTVFIVTFPDKNLT